LGLDSPGPLDLPSLPFRASRPSIAKKPGEFRENLAFAALIGVIEEEL